MSWHHKTIRARASWRLKLQSINGRLRFVYEMARREELSRSETFRSISNCVNRWPNDRYSTSGLPLRDSTYHRYRGFNAPGERRPDRDDYCGAAAHCSARVSATRSRGRLTSPPFQLSAPARALVIKSLFEKSVLGSAGYQPVPSGDSPDGTARASATHPDTRFTGATSAIPVGGSPTGAGESPAPPIFQTGSNVCQRAATLCSRPPG